MIIQVDSREQKNQEILDYFEKIGQKYFVSKMYSGDYQDANHPTILIDTKKDLLELSNNVTKQHARFKEEIRKANEDMGCKLIVLIREPLKSLEDVKTYKFRKYRNGKPISQMNPETLYKIMYTMQERYNLEFRFTTRQKAGEEIIKILKGEDNETR